MGQSAKVLHVVRSRPWSGTNEAERDALMRVRGTRRRKMEGDLTAVVVCFGRRGFRVLGFRRDAGAVTVCV